MERRGFFGTIAGALGLAAAAKTAAGFGKVAESGGVEFDPKNRMILHYDEGWIVSWNLESNRSLGVKWWEGEHYTNNPAWIGRIQCGDGNQVSLDDRDLDEAHRLPITMLKTGPDGFIEFFAKDERGEHVWHRDRDQGLIRERWYGNVEFKPTYLQGD